jgi:hypothetical protein
MKFGNLSGHPGFSRLLLIGGALCAIILLNSIFIIGGDEGFSLSSTLLSPIAALAASFLFFRAKAIVKNPNFQRLWLWMGVGFGLWGLADVIWAIYALWFSDQLPSVSVADLLWIVGYIPLYMALLIRLRTIEHRPTTTQKWIIAIICTAWTLYTALIGIRPILSDLDPERLVEGVVLLAYPIGDLGLVVLVSIILFMLQGGRYAVSWRLVFIGIFVMAFSDIVYNYAVWRDLYYPEGKVNFVTNLTDTSYILAYLLSGIGAYVYSYLWKIKEQPEMRVVTIPSTRFQCFLGTNHENEIISTSENFAWLMNAKSNSQFYRVPLSEAWGIDPQSLRTVMEKIIDQGSIYQEPVTIITLDKKSRQVMLSALATYDMDHEFTGVNFVIQADIKPPVDLQLPQTRDLQAISRHVLFSASVLLKEGDKALRAYFVDKFRLLLSVLYQFGGDQHENEIFTELSRMVAEKNWDVRISDAAIEVSEDYEGEELAGILSELIHNVQNQIAKHVGAQVVQEKLNEFEQEMSLNLPSSLDQNRLNSHMPQSG